MQTLCPAALPRSCTGSWPFPPITSKSQSSESSRANLPTCSYISPSHALQPNHGHAGLNATAVIYNHRPQRLSDVGGSWVLRRPGHEPASRVPFQRVRALRVRRPHAHSRRRKGQHFGDQGKKQHGGTVDRALTVLLFISADSTVTQYVIRICICEAVRRWRGDLRWIRTLPGRMHSRWGSKRHQGTIRYMMHLLWTQDGVRFDYICTESYR